MRLLLPRDAQQLDPRFVTDAYGLKISRLIFASLVTIDPRTLEVVNDLADTIEQVSDVEYRVALREGLAFSDGSELDAHDVVETFRGIVDPELESVYAGTYRRIEQVEAIDELTIRFVLDAPHATFLTDLEVPIVRAQDAHRRVALPGGEMPVGAGPYRLVQRETGRFLLEANGRWHGGIPNYRRLEMVVIRDDNTRALRLQAGFGDAAINAIPPLLVPMFEAHPAFEVRSVRGVGTTYLGFHTERVDARLRQAIAHAIDRQLLIETELGGRAEPTSSWVPAGHWSSVEGLPDYPYDPERARQLIEEAGAGGRRLILRTTAERRRLSVARAMAAMLRAVGLEVDVRPSEMASLIADLNGGRFELTYLQMPELFEPHLLHWFFASERVPEDGRRGANRWRLRDAALDSALERGRHHSERSIRVAAYTQVQRILAERLPVLPLWQEHTVVVARKGKVLDAPRDGRFSVLAH